MKLKRAIFINMTAIVLGINCLTNVFAERVVLKNVSGDVNLTNISHYSTNSEDKSHKIVFKLNSKEVLADDKLITIDEFPFVNQGTTLLPLRIISETMSIFGNSSSIDWNSVTKKATLKYQDKEIIFTQDSKIYTIDGKSYTMENSSPIIKNGRIFIPLRVLANAMELNVEWDNTLKEIIIKNK